MLRYTCKYLCYLFTEDLNENIGNLVHLKSYDSFLLFTMNASKILKFDLVRHIFEYSNCKSDDERTLFNQNYVLLFHERFINDFKLINYAASLDMDIFIHELKHQKFGRLNINYPTMTDLAFPQLSNKFRDNHLILILRR